MKKISTYLLCMVLVFTCMGCSHASSNQSYDIDYGTKEKEITSSFSANESSSKVSISSENAEALYAMIDHIVVDFPYSHLYMTDECYERLQTKPSVSAHGHSALNSSGALDVHHFMSIVKDNNRKYLAENDFLLEEIEEDNLLEICTLVIDTIKDMQQKQPEIDYERVFCNLANLKLLYKQGQISYAQITTDLVFNISQTMFQTADVMTEENGCRNVVIHEVMHIMQMGCVCENIEHCIRRCGISYYWDDFEVNTSDFKWFNEGAAERAMCNLTGDEPTTYESMINYVCALNYCTVLDKDNPANYAETLTFQDDVNKLYDMFDCETEDDIKEILNLMIAVNIIQMEAEDWLEFYAKDQEVIDELHGKLKPAIAMVMTKHFYNNLIGALAENAEVTIDDVCYLISLFEVMLHSQIRYTNAENDVYNQDFIAMYKTIRSEFFARIVSDGDADISTYYTSYVVFENEESKVIGATLKWCEDAKRDFLLERTDYFAYNLKTKIFIN